VKSIEVTAQGANGFAGDIALTVEGLDANAEAKFDKTTVKAGEKAVLRVYSKKAGSLPFTIKGTSAGVPEQTKSIGFTVSKTLTLHMKMGAQAAQNSPDVFSPGFQGLTNPNSVFVVTGALPLVVKCINDDTTPHTVHGNGAFAHGDTAAPLPQNGADPINRQFATAATLTGYIHENGAGSRNFSITAN
jgi:hypothetical protein